MSRARILADYVSSGDELALKAPIAGPTFTGTVGGLGTPVINLGSATGAIPAGVTGGAGLTGSTSLGTVTVGDISHADIVYPAGHIVKTSAQTTGTTRTDINVGNGTFTDTVVTAAFTPTFDDSDVIVHVWYVIWVTNSTGDCGSQTRFKRAISGGATTYPASLEMSSSGGNGTAYMYVGAADVAYVENYGVWHSLIDSPATDEAITYTLQCEEYNSEGMYCGAGNGAGSRWHIWFQEVKR